MAKCVPHGLPASVPPPLIFEEQEPASDDFEEPEVHRSYSLRTETIGKLNIHLL